MSQVFCRIVVVPPHCEIIFVLPYNYNIIMMYIKNECLFDLLIRFGSLTFSSCSISICRRRHIYTATKNIRERLWGIFFTVMICPRKARRCIWLIRLVNAPNIKIERRMKIIITSCGILIDAAHRLISLYITAMRVLFYI